MKKVIFAIILGILVGCSGYLFINIYRPTTKFKYLDKVNVKSGFYEGFSGTLIKQDTVGFQNIYIVENVIGFNLVQLRVAAHDLEKLK